jgi:hypothetical protein
MRGVPTSDRVTWSQPVQMRGAICQVETQVEQRGRRPRSVV